MYGTGEREMSEPWWPPYIHGEFHAFVCRRAAREVQFFQSAQLPHRLVQTLVAYTLTHKAQIEHFQLGAF